jgi:hypothetical protein
VVEDPEPRGGAVGHCGQLPVDEPESTDFFQKGIEAARTENEVPEWCWADKTSPTVGDVINCPQVRP